MVCFTYIIANTLQKCDDDDDTNNKSFVPLTAFSTVPYSFYFFRPSREIYTLTSVTDPSQLVPLTDTT